jgi:hypothetical protein
MVEPWLKKDKSLCGGETRVIQTSAVIHYQHNHGDKTWKN